MTETTYLPEVECVVDIPNSGVVFDTAVVGVPDVTGNRHYLRVRRGSLVTHKGKTYLPIAVVEVNPVKARALIELPYEADSGWRRLWVSFGAFRTSED